MKKKIIVRGSGMNKARWTYVDQKYEVRSYGVHNNDSSRTQATHDNFNTIEFDSPGSPQKQYHVIGLSSGMK